jgi:hypothetical protein
MHSRLVFLPAAIVAAAPAVTPDVVWADTIQTLDAAQRLLFPREPMTPADFKLTPEQFERLKSEYSVPALRPLVKAWRSRDGQWMFLDQVYGLGDIITYVVAVDANGSVRGVEILTCAEGYCDLYTREWRASLVGQKHGKWEPTEVVPMVSGATLSCTHVAEGVKKILAIHARFLPGRSR